MIRIGEEEILDIIDYNRFKNPSDAAILLKIVLSVAEGIMRGREDLNTTRIQEGITEFKVMMESLKKHY